VIGKRAGGFCIGEGATGKQYQKKDALNSFHVRQLLLRAGLGKEDAVSGPMIRRYSFSKFAGRKKEIAISMISGRMYFFHIAAYDENKKRLKVE